MDLSDISRERTLIDLEMARVRILDLTVRIEEAAAELQELRAEWSAVKGSAVDEDSSGSAASAAAKAGSIMTFWRKSGKRSALRWHLDEICGQAPPRGKQGIQHVVRRSNSWMLTLSGWVVPGEGTSAFESVRLSMTGVEGVISRQAAMHLRDDVAGHFGNPAFAMSGFRFELPMSELTSMSYDLELVCFGSASGEHKARLGRIELA